MSLHSFIHENLGWKLRLKKETFDFVTLKCDLIFFLPSNTTSIFARKDDEKNEQHQLGDNV